MSHLTDEQLADASIPRDRLDDLGYLLTRLCMQAAAAYVEDTDAAWERRETTWTAVVDLVERIRSERDEKVSAERAVMKVWIVAQVKDLDTGDWELGGVFSTRERAIAACTHPDDGIWEETLDQAYPRETEYVRTFNPLQEPDAGLDDDDFPLYAPRKDFPVISASGEKDDA